VYEAFHPAGPGDASKPPSPFRVAGQVIEDAVSGAANTVVDEAKNHPGRFALEAGGAVVLGVAATAGSPIIAGGAALVGAGEATVAGAATVGTAIEGLAATTLGIGTVGGGVAAAKNIKDGLNKSENDIEIVTHPEKYTPQEITQANKNIEANLGPGALQAILTAGGAIVAGGNAARLLGRVSIAGKVVEVGAPTIRTGEEAADALSGAKAVVQPQWKGGLEPQSPVNIKDWVKPDSPPVSTEIDSVTGKLKSETWTTSDKSSLVNSVRMEYDPATGKPSSTIEHSLDGTLKRTEWDPITGNIKSESTSNPQSLGMGQTYTEYDPATGHMRFTDEASPLDWFAKHTEYEYDPATGKLQYENWTSFGRSEPLRVEQGRWTGPKSGSGRTEYDLVTGNLKSESSARADGYEVKQEYDPVTGDIKSRDQIYDHGASTRHVEYYPGKDPDGLLRVKSQYSKHADGSWDRVDWQYDERIGRLKSMETTNSKNSIKYEEYDPVTGKLMFEDLTEPDGTKGHITYDPVTSNIRSQHWTDPNIPEGPKQ
jgi:hypothetical protein